MLDAWRIFWVTCQWYIHIFFGVFTFFVACLFPVYWLFGLGAALNIVDYCASLCAVIVYHAAAALHNGYSTKIGLFRNHGKWLGHFALCVFSLGAIGPK